MENLNFFEKSVKVVDKYGGLKVFQAILLVALFVFVIFGIPAITKVSVEKALVKNEENKEIIHTQDIENRRKVQPQIYSILDNLLTTTNADRAFIIELHNGSRNLNSIPFLHGTVTYEKVKDGVENIDEEYQNLSLSRYEFADYLHKHYTFIGTIDELCKIDKKLGAKLRANDVDAVAVTSLYDGTNEWGWFGVIYSDVESMPSKEDILNNLFISSQSVTKIL